jgi:ribosomal protein S18 acetylase RimI-like enzyme
MEGLHIRRLRVDENFPMALLLFADPSHEVVESYIHRGQCFVGQWNGEIIGIYVLIDTRPQTVELVNVAVAEEKHGKGIGKQLVRHAIETARSMGYKTIELGTGNAGIGQLALYQKCGFRIVGVDLDFFTLHYPEPIYENGIHCRDMIRLALHL